MIKINLLPVKAAKKKEKIFIQMLFGGLVIILALAGIGWRYYTQLDRIEAVELEIKKTEEKIKKLQEAKKKFEELKKKKDILEKQLAAITKLDTGRDWFIRVLEKITESVPRKQVWISTLKFGGGGRQGGANSITISGQSYDEDAVALFMGNLSIIACDDELKDEEKAEICRVRNERCRAWNDEEKNWEWDFEGCRRFYKKTCDDSKSCGEDIKACQVTEKNACQMDPKSAACRDSKEKCNNLDTQCRKLKQDCAKLLEKQYIVYDNVILKFIKLSKVDPKTGISTYSYEINVSATEAPVK